MLIIKSFCGGSRGPRGAGSLLEVVLLLRMLSITLLVTCHLHLSPVVIIKSFAEVQGAVFQKSPLVTEGKKGSR
jgi:hypothetical protein